MSGASITPSRPFGLLSRLPLTRFLLYSSIGGACVLAAYLWRRRRLAPAEDLDLEADIVAFSSRLIAAERALESRKPADQRLIYDPLAELLAGPRAIERVQERPARMAAARGKEGSKRGGQGGESSAASSPEPSERRSTHAGSGPPSSRPRIAIRTRFFDDWLERVGALSVADGSSSPLLQTVLLGAGMDSRAFRLPCFTRLSSSAADARPCRFFELDQPAVLSIKRRLIDTGIREEKIQGPLCERIEVECNFAASEPDSVEAAAAFASSSPSSAAASSFSTAAVSLPVVPVHWTVSLQSAGFDRHQPSCWLLEGLLMYLSEEEQLALLKNLSALSAVGSQLGLSHVNQTALKRATRPVDLEEGGTVEESRSNHATPAASAASSSSSSASPSPPSPTDKSDLNKYRSLLMQWRSFLSPAFLALLSSSGWTVRTLTQLGAADANYGLWQSEVFPIEDESKGRVLYLLAEKTS